MRIRTLAALAIPLLSLVLSAQTADEIIAKNIQARGGLAKIKALRTMRVTGDFESGGMQAGFTQVYKRPMKCRLDVSVQGMTMTQAYDSQNGWQIVPFTGNKDPVPMNADDRRNIEEEADFDGPLMDYKQKGNSVELVGKEKMDGAEVYHLKLTLKNGSVRNLYLDADKFITIKMSSKTVLQGTEVELENTYGDYKQVEGILFPFSIQQRVAGGKLPDQKITFKTVELNIPLDDAIFKMPATAPAPANQK